MDVCYNQLLMALVQLGTDQLQHGVYKQWPPEISVIQSGCLFWCA